jgi:anti-sigma factor NepR-like protein
MTKENKEDKGMLARSSTEETATKKPALDRQVQAHIGRKLKAVYDEVASEPLPTSLMDLLQQLESRNKQ